MLARVLNAGLLCLVAQRLLICAHGQEQEKTDEDGGGKVNLALTFKLNDGEVFRRLFENLDKAMTVGDLKTALGSGNLWAASDAPAADVADSSGVRVAIVADATDEEVEDDNVTLSTLLEKQQQQQNDNTTESKTPQEQVDDKEGEESFFFKNGFLQGLSAIRRPGEKDVVKLTSIISTKGSLFSADFLKTVFSTFDFFKLADALLKGKGRIFKPLFCFCPLVKAPVCGVDGVTYYNECLLKCKQVELKHVGRCQNEGERPENPGGSDKDCECPLIFKPVCGTDGKTYANKCVLKCLKKTFAHDGKCSTNNPGAPNVPPHSKCPDTIEPVCGVDNRTYKNSCLLKLANVALKHAGPCTDDDIYERCGCTKEIRPVCGKDGNSYMNKCLLKCNEVDFKHDGPCHAIERSCPCTYEYKPVCGVDGVTYANNCILDCEGIRLAHRGECGRGDTADGHPSCPPTDDPVCGTDGVTYLNSCWASSKKVNIAHKGRCKEDHDRVCACPNVDAPVCGMDGVTYKNKCQLDCANVRLAALGKCTDQPCKCSKIYDPVCGANGVTYRNSCYLRCNNVRLAYRGACRQAIEETQGAARALSSVIGEVPADKKCDCPPTHEPVCGRDGQTYTNFCEMVCKEVDFAHEGECTPEEEPCKCSKEYKPVCATNGKTYPNICLMNCDGAVFLHTGKCTKEEQKKATREEEPCVCPDVLEFVCGADGKTYSSLCDLKCSGTRLFHYGECDFKEITPDCPLTAAEPCVCPDLYSPVCGADGITYDSPCHLECAQVALKHYGECERDETKCDCPDTTEPVCGSDGKTYQNACLLACAGALLVHPGPCSDTKQPEGILSLPRSCACPLNLDPVCGVDGQTYYNQCLAACRRVAVKHRGECQSESASQPPTSDERVCRCPRVRDLVCGADGKTYKNRCLLKCQAIEFVHYGQCAAGDKPVCGDHIDPVCGTNNETYTNDCLRHQAGVLLKFRRRCNETHENYVCSCPKRRDPVCGRDSKTYRNECEMECRRVELDHRGKCLCPCPRILDPVCGSDGKTYANKCLMECEGTVQLLYYGMCAPRNICPDTVSPVCGTNGKTYANDCLRHQDGAELFQRNVCRHGDRNKVVVTVANCSCPTNTALVCGKDGRTYLNECVMKCARVDLAYRGRCRIISTPALPQPPQVCPCPRILDPVCGSDGKTYNNKCLMECGRQATLLYYGRCIEGGIATDACPDTVAPVCATNGKTYANDCLRYRDGATLLQRDFCRHANPAKVVDMVQRCPCPTKTDLVCGKDGRTYVNECVMKYALVDLAHRGECRRVDPPGPPRPPQDCPCPRILDPVCGSDGKTYNNKCLMECAGDVKLLYYGKCGTANTCPDVTEPVCSTTGKTYKNDCMRFFDGAVLKERNTCPGSTAPVQDVFCKCPAVVDIVCGRDGRTYVNRCEMECRQVSINHTGKCFREHASASSAYSLCSTEYLPVCGEDGTTYGNKCLLEAQQVAFRSDGPCSESNIPVASSANQPLCQCPRHFEPVCGINDITFPNACVLQCYNVAQQHEGQCLG